MTVSMIATGVAAIIGTIVAFAPPEPIDPLARCDQRVLALPQAERDYQCYAGVARQGESTVVLDHLRSLTRAHPDDGRMWLALGAMEGDFGNDPSEPLRIAVRTLAAQGLPQYQIQAQLNLARRLSREGDSDGAWVLLTEAREVADALQHPILSAIVEFDTLGEVAKQLDGDLLAAYRRASDAYAALPDNAPYPVRRNGLQLLARAARSLGRTRLAASLAQDAAQIAEDAGDTHSALHAWRSVARNQLREKLIGNDPNAVASFRQRLQALLIRTVELDNPLAELSVRVDLAYTAPPAEQPQAWAACHALAKALDASGAAATCKGGLAESLAATQPQRASALAAELVASARSSTSARSLADAHRVQGTVATTIGDHDAAWQAWQAMFDAFEQITSAPTDAELRGLLRADGSERYRVAAGSTLAADPTDRVALKRAFEAMERMRGRETLEFSRRAGLAGHSPTSPITLDDVTGHIRDDTALIVFQVGQGHDVAGQTLGGSWALVITANGARAFGLPDAGVLDPAVAMVADGLAGPASQSASASSEALYTMLLEEPLRDLPPTVRRLVVLPDGQLHRLPLGALLHEGQPLSARFAVSAAASATTWVGSLGRGALPRSLVALADPSPAPVVESTFGLATPLGRLPDARRESELAAHFVGGHSRVLIGDAASEAVLKEARQRGVLHIAAHAVVDHARPEASRLLLAAGDGEDGHVSLDELSALELDGALVVLAACQGADGELLAAEGALSPAQALFAAGAGTVVAGLWPVQDAEAAAFFSEFYAGLDDGLAVDQAVSRAQEHRRLAGAPTSAWAGFVVYGDGSVTLEPPPGPQTWHWALFAAALGALAGLGSRRAFRVFFLPGR